MSAVWSVQPDGSWQDAGRMFAYSALFGAAIALARAAPARWPAVMGGVILAAAVVCGWALLTKVFPDQLDAKEVYARLRAPYTYWNAIGLTAAMGAIACMWLGARRSGHALLSALAYPAMGLTLLTLPLSPRWLAARAPTPPSSASARTLSRIAPARRRVAVERTRRPP